ncbi:MAG: T9SS type A sorting domain-containing protein [Crocinitomicaceae bacterium]|nr:T9SS type A sorting domain-containing protein [Crocinitomicaceae bacterium]
MKKIFTLLFITAAGATTTIAQDNAGDVQHEAKKIQCKSFFKTPPIRDIMYKVEPASQEIDWSIPPKDRKHEGMSWDEISDHGIPETGGIDPVLQTEQGDRDGSKMLKANFQGLSSSGYPPDPTGAAGINYYVQAVNSTYRVYSKDGFPESPALGLSSLWTGSSNDGDPIVMYDRYADRWFISQFQVSSNEILIAISETSDPLGSYYAYEWSFSSFPDYPKFGVWSNAYFMTANTNGPDCVAYEREKMLTGDPTASMITMYFPSMSLFFNSVAPAYAEGLTAPDANEPGWAFAVQDDSWGGISYDHIKILKITLDWDVPSNSDVVIHQSLATSSFNSSFTWSWDDITQPGTSQKLDAVAGIFMYRAQYRRFTGYDVMLLTHTVDVNNANRAGVRWYELRKDDGSDQWYVYQESTYDPNDGNSRWMGNAAMDLNGHIGLAYSISGSVYPGLRYTGRYSTDAINTMTVQEQNAQDGSGSQTVTNRYGDYSQMTVDPSDDATFWFTGEYIGAGGFPKTRIFSFAMWELLGEEEEYVSNPYFNAYQPNPAELTIIWKDLKDEQFDIMITDVSGKLIAKEANVDATLGQKVFDVPSYATGIYVVSLIGENTQLSEKVYFAR